MFRYPIVFVRGERFVHRRRCGVLALVVAFPLLGCWCGFIVAGAAVYGLDGAHVVISFVVLVEERGLCPSVASAARVNLDSVEVWFLRCAGGVEGGACGG